MDSVLDIEAVRAFVLVADLRGFTRAAEASATTQSAISLRIKRLEEAMGRRLVERTPRLVRLSSDGVAFLDSARALLAAHEAAAATFLNVKRRLVVGISHHVVGAELPGLLRRLHLSDPALVVEMRVETSRRVLASYDQGDLDLAIVLATGSSRQDGEVVMQESFGWMAAADFAWNPGEELRLAAQEADCSVRTMAMQALDEAGIAWTETFIGGGITTIGAAVSAGLAVAALARRIAPAGTVDVGPRFGLPALPKLDIVAHARLTEPETRASARRLIAALRTTALA